MIDIISNLPINVCIINDSKYPLPEYATAQSAGMDLYANIEESVTLGPLDRYLFPTGVSIALPVGYEAQIRPRSGLAAKKGISIVNSPGTIDADYRGEVRVNLVNISKDVVTIDPGDRIAQMVVAKHAVVKWIPTDTLDETERGAGGHGSTGK